jgi:predicted nucleic acid-binding protein
VALKWVLTEPDSPRALSVRDNYRKQLHELLAPDVFPVEIARALTRAERKGLIKPPQAARLLADVLSSPMPLHSYLPLLPRAVAISSAMRSGVYDRLYVALAEREGSELLTADDKLLKNLEAQFPFIVSLASTP